MKRRRRMTAVGVFVVGMTIGLLSFKGGALAQAAEPGTGAWSGSGALGFLGNTIDGTAFALNFNADGFLTRNVSFGPLLQLAFTGDMTQVGFSGQAKYWIAIPETGNRAKLVLQAGLGFVHADFLRSDTSWLIPLGVGLDYAVHRSLSLTTTFLLNFTDLDTGPGTHTNVMPGLTFGVRF